MKEGVCQDYQFQGQLSKLLYFESSKLDAGETTSLDEYVGRCAPDQKEIYFLCAPTRELCLASPYMEAFEGSGREVVFVYTAIDDFVMSNLRTFEDRELVTAEKGGLSVDKTKKEDGDEEGEDGKKKKEGGEEDEEKKADDAMDQVDADILCGWMQNVALGGKVESVKTTTRLGRSPAIVTGHESGALRQMMKQVDTQGNATGTGSALGAQAFEINPSHSVIKAIAALSKGGGEKEEMAKIAAEQVFHNAVVNAGLMDDARHMIPNINRLLEEVLKVRK